MTQREWMLTGNILLMLLSASRVLGVADSVPVELEKAVCDVGEVFQGKAVEVVLRLKNSGTVSCAIVEARAGCTCTVVDGNGKTIEPGNTQDIRVRVDTGAKPSGAFNEKILLVLKYGDVTRQLGAQVSGSVSEEGKWRAVPTALLLGDVERGEEFARTMRISRVGDEHTKVISLEKPDWISTQLREVSNGEWILAVQGKAPLGDGILRDKVVVITDSAKCPRVEIPVWIYAQGPVKCVPSEIVWLAEEAEDETEIKLVLRGKSLVSKVVCDPYSAPKQYEWSHEGVDDRGAARIVLRRKAGERGKAIESWVQRMTATVDGKEHELSVNTIVIRKSMTALQHLP